MCIFSKPVKAVGNTRIFARRTAEDTQFIVYQMNYHSAGQNAMILPVPVRQPSREDSVRFIDLSEYDSFFNDLENGFPYSSRIAIGCSSPPQVAADAALEVFEVGNYIASFVPRISDFERLEDRFRLPSAVWEQVPQYARYGFAAFQLAEGSLQPHPMAFEFDTDIDEIYFPTLHIHDGEIHTHEIFDHTLYMQHAGFDSRVYSYDDYDSVDKSTGLVRSETIASEFCSAKESRGVVRGNLLVHKMSIRGARANRDTEVAVTGDPVHPTLNYRPWISRSPWLIVAAVVSWLFLRRQRVKSGESQSGSAPKLSSQADG